jgi:hypothetical protein
MSFREALFVGAITFFQNAIGIVTRPYETSRRIAVRSRVFELPLLAVFLFAYFAVASLVKTAAFRPYLLTRQFVVLCLGAGFLYAVAVIAIWQASKVVGGKGGLRRIAISWAYTLIPTAIWFLITSLLFVILPPPRTSSVQGIVFSILYLVLSTTLLFWKIILAYLAIRFSMKLDLLRIIGASLIASPFIIVASWCLYKLGIFRVPFL